MGSPTKKKEESKNEEEKKEEKAGAGVEEVEEEQPVRSPRRRRVREEEEQEEEKAEESKTLEEEPKKEEGEEQTEVEEQENEEDKDDDGKGAGVQEIKESEKEESKNEDKAEEETEKKSKKLLDYVSPLYFACHDKVYSILNLKDDVNRRLLLAILTLMLGITATFLLSAIIASTTGPDVGVAQSATIFLDPTIDMPKMIDILKNENAELKTKQDLLNQLSMDPIKIKGKDGAKCRMMRKKVNSMITQNEELRLAIAKYWASEQPYPQTEEFTNTLVENYKLRLDVETLKNFADDVTDLQDSLIVLDEEHYALLSVFNEYKYRKAAIPKELDVVSREIESLLRQVREASRKKKQPSNLDNAKNYIMYMSQILSTMSSVSEFEEAGVFGKIDIASDIFNDLAPKASSIPVPVQEKLRQGRSKFEELKVSLANKWKQLKALSEPENIRAASTDTLTKMNRVLVNVVSKLKDIGQVAFLKRGKTPVDKTADVLSERLSVLDKHFDKTWDELEHEVNMSAVNPELAEAMIKDDGSALTLIVPADEPQQPDNQEEDNSDAVAKTKTEQESKFDSTPSEKNQKVKTSKKGERKEDSNKKQEQKNKNKEDKKGREEKKVKKDDKEKSRKVKSKEKDVEKEEKKKETSKKEKKEKKEKNKIKSDTKSKGSSKDKKSETKKKEADAKIKDKYFKGHYNRDKNDNSLLKDSENTKTENSKHIKRRNDDDEDYEEDDEEAEDSDSGKRGGLRRHWEKPMKKNSFRESSERNFIRRKGKEGNVGIDKKEKGLDKGKLKSDDGKTSPGFRLGQDEGWSLDRNSLKKHLRDAQKLLKKKLQERKQKLKKQGTDGESKKRNKKQTDEDWRTYKRSINRQDDDEYDFYGRAGNFVKRRVYEKSGSRYNKERHRRRHR